MNTPKQDAEESMQTVDLFPSLDEVVKAGGLDPKKLSVGLKTTDKNRPDVSAREQVLITDGSKAALWTVPSLRALFRGDKPAPAMPSEPPPEYLPRFHFVEQHVVTFCDAFGDKTDGEFEEVFSNLRRRPDGKSPNELHFFLWQVAAGLAGLRPLSAAEFDAILGRLTKSARTFRMGIVSRNYIATLRQTI